MANAALIRELTEDPDTLWAILTSSEVRIAGPWVWEGSTDERFGVWKRLHWHEGTMAEVWQFRESSAPDRRDYYDYVDKNDDYHTADEQFEADLRDHTELLARAKKWVCRVRLPWSRMAYADTAEEARALADQALRAQGCGLVSSNPS